MIDVKNTIPSQKWVTADIMQSHQELKQEVVLEVLQDYMNINVVVKLLIFTKFLMDVKEIVAVKHNFMVQAIFIQLTQLKNLKL